MNRHLSLALIALLSSAAPALGDGMDPGVPAQDPAAAKAAAPGSGLASDEAVAAAFVTYKEAWKAKGLKGEEKLGQRDWALDELSKLQHPLIAAELGSVARAGEGDLRLIAVIYLARQKSLAGTAGAEVLQALQKNVKDVAFVLSALQTLGKLGYLGGDDQLRDLLKHEDWAIRKCAITTIGQVTDMRLVDDLLKILGVDLKGAPPPPPAADDKKGGKEVVEEGYSWEGAEATADHGDSDNTKENAEAKAKAEAQMAANKAAAAAGASNGGAGGVAGGAGGGASMGGGGGRGGGGRNPSELKPYVLQALKKLTGETFMNSREVRLWFDKNMAVVEQKKKACDVSEATQRSEAKADAKK